MNDDLMMNAHLKSHCNVLQSLYALLAVFKVSCESPMNNNVMNLQVLVFE